MLTAEAGFKLATLTCCDGAARPALPRSLNATDLVATVNHHALLYLKSTWEPRPPHALAVGRRTGGPSPLSRVPPDSLPEQRGCLAAVWPRSSVLQCTETRSARWAAFPAASGPGHAEGDVSQETRVGPHGNCAAGGRGHCRGPGPSSSWLPPPHSIPFDPFSSGFWTLGSWPDLAPSPPLIVLELGPPLSIHPFTHWAPEARVGFQRGPSPALASESCVPCEVHPTACPCQRAALAQTWVPARPTAVRTLRPGGDGATTHRLHPVLLVHGVGWKGSPVSGRVEQELWVL